MRILIIGIAVMGIVVNKAHGSIAGSISWKKNYRYGDKLTDFHDVKIDHEGYYVAIAFVNDRTWLLKLDPKTGDTVLSRIYDGHPHAIAIDRDNNYVIAATRGGYDIYIDAVIFKVDSRTGNVIWRKIYGEENLEDKILDIAVLPNGDYLGVGLKEHYSVYHGRADRLWVVYMDSKTGDTLYTHRYDELAYTSIGYAVTVDHNGNVYIGGTLKDRSEGPSYGFILRIDETTGKIRWKKLLGSSKDNNIYDLIVDPFDHLVGVGSSVDFRKKEYEGWIFIVDPRKKKLIGERLFDAIEKPSETRFRRIAWDPQTWSYVVGGYYSPTNEKERVENIWVLNIEPERFRKIWERKFERLAFRAVSVDSYGRTIIAGFEKHRPYSTWFIQLKGFGDDTYWFRVYGSISRIKQILKLPGRKNNLIALTDTEDRLKLLGIWHNNGNSVKLFEKKNEYGGDFDYLDDSTYIMASYRIRSIIKTETILRVLGKRGNRIKVLHERKLKNLKPESIKKINDTLTILIGIDPTSDLDSYTVDIIRLHIDRNRKIKSLSRIRSPKVSELMGVNIMPEEGLIILWGGDLLNPYIKVFDYRKQELVLNEEWKESSTKIYKILDLTTKDGQIIALGTTGENLIEIPVLITINISEKSTNIAKIESPEIIDMRVIFEGKLIYTGDSTYILSLSSYESEKSGSETLVFHIFKVDSDMKPTELSKFGVIEINSDKYTGYMEISRTILYGPYLYIAGEVRKGLPYVMKFRSPLLRQ